MSQLNVSEPNVLLVDDDESLLRLMAIRLKGEGYNVQCAGGGKEALRLINTQNFDVVLSDLRMPGLDGLSLFEEIMGLGKDVPVILMTAHGTIQDAVEATQRGVFGFLTKPIDHVELRSLMEKAVSQSQGAQVGQWCEKIITRSMQMEQLLDQAYRVAKRDVSVLISGASGTGKELLASAIHKASKRADKAFVAINCGALPENLLESELFGHAKGSFTGAINEHKGLFREADGGTLFLDEIGDMPVDLQAHLLRVLEEREVTPLGAKEPVSVDVRIICATHEQRPELIAKGLFRNYSDYRIKGAQRTLSPLRERTDIDNIIETIVADERGDGAEVTISDEVMEIFRSYAWPGNIRELNHMIERAIFLRQGQVITAADLGLNNATLDQLPNPKLENIDINHASLDVIEKTIIKQRLEQFNDNSQETASSLGLSRSAYYRRLEKHNLPL